jgi:hypothetical protein
MRFRVAVGSELVSSHAMMTQERECIYRALTWLCLPEAPRRPAGRRGSSFRSTTLLWREHTRLADEHVLVLTELGKNNHDDASGIEQLPEASDGYVRPLSLQLSGTGVISKRCRYSVLRRKRSLAAACKCRYPCKHQPILLIWGQFFLKGFRIFEACPL